MRRYEHLSIDTTRVYTLQFVAENLTIFNPTARTVVVRSGGSDIPSSVTTADIVCPPSTTVTVPVRSDTFAVGFSDPTLSVATPNKDVVLIWTQGEQPPVINGIPLDNIISKYNSIFLGTVNTTNSYGQMDITVSPLASGILLVYYYSFSGTTPNYVNVHVYDNVNADTIYKGIWSIQTGSLLVPVNPSSQSYTVMIDAYGSNVAIDIFEYQGPVNLMSLSNYPYRNSVSLWGYNAGTINPNSTVSGDIVLNSPFFATAIYAELSGSPLPSGNYELTIYLGHVSDNRRIAVLTPTLASGKYRFYWNGNVFVDITMQTIGFTLSNPTGYTLNYMVTVTGHMF